MTIAILIAGTVAFLLVGLRVFALLRQQRPSALPSSGGDVGYYPTSDPTTGPGFSGDTTSSDGGGDCGGGDGGGGDCAGD